MRRPLRLSAAFIVAALSLAFGSRALAQEPQEESPPKPAGSVAPALGGYNDQDTAEEQQTGTNLTPDTLPLTGAQIPDIGTPEMRHSYWVPGFQYTNLVRSSTLNEPAIGNWNTTSYVLGNMSLLQSWSHAQLALNYSGGGSFSSDASQGNSYIQQLGMVQAFAGARWKLSLIDQFSYLPQAYFGFAAATNLATPGIGGPLEPSLPNLQINYLPSQTIFSSFGPRYSNAAIAQFSYAISRRGTVTFSGSYGILRFVQAGNIDSNDAIFSAGYSYAVSQRDTLGLVYRFTGYRYLGNLLPSINDQVAQLAYGRKITGKLALQLFAGPEITDFRTPFSSSTRKISGSGGANLTYALERTRVMVSYNRAVSGGSGVLTGSTADQVETGISHQISRVWRGDVSFGFVRNTSLGLIGPSQLSPTYDVWYVAAGLNRPLGRNATLNFGYSAYLENANQSVCTGCGNSYLQHQIFVGFQWHAPPFVIH
jgi:hypothetical protein